MSYILDALKKSEQQRPPGQVPDLFTVHGPQPPSPRRPARAIVVVALILTVSAVALWRWIGTGARNEDAARLPAVASPQPRAAALVEPVSPRTAAAPASLAQTPAAAGGAARRPNGAPAKTPPLSVRKARGSVPASPVPAAAPAVSPVPAVPTPAAAPVAAIATPPALVATPPPPLTSSPAPAASSPAPLTSPSAPAASSPESVTSLAGASPHPPPEPASGPAAAAAAAEEIPPADGRVLNLAELPVPVRAQLPKLLVSGHVWSEEPSLRLLNIDDRLLHEGGEAAPGVSLQEITPSGAVFVFRGWRFRVPGGRP